LKSGEIDIIEIESAEFAGLHPATVAASPLLAAPLPFHRQSFLHVSL
jgi:hypothetical protein